MSRHHTHLDARRWGIVRRRVFERDGWRCVECGKSGKLECDHVAPLPLPAKVRLEDMERNGQTPDHFGPGSEGGVKMTPPMGCRR